MIDPVPADVRQAYASQGEYQTTKTTDHPPGGGLGNLLALLSTSLIATQPQIAFEVLLGLSLQPLTATANLLTGFEKGVY